MPATPAETVVLKFGGTSVGSPERIRAVAKIVKSHARPGTGVVVVVSAMGETTDELIALARSVSPAAMEMRNRREMDMLLSTGERVSMSLLSLALSDLGVQAVSFTGSQSGIITDTFHGEARIFEIKPVRLIEALAAGKVVIVAGFQGVSREKEITTLGRGGSDTSAVALAVALKARETVIYTDVDGIFTADPRQCPPARRLEKIGWDTALEAAYCGAQVLHPRCVELAWKHDMPVQVRSSFSEGRGSRVAGVDMTSLEGPKVLSIAQMKDVVLCRKRMSPAEGAELLKKLAAAGVRYAGWSQTTEGVEVIAEAAQAEALKKVGTWDEILSGLVRVSLTGAGLSRDPALHEKFQDLFTRAAVRVRASSVSASVISVLCDASPKIAELLQQAHQAFI